MVRRPIWSLEKKRGGGQVVNVRGRGLYTRGLAGACVEEGVHIMGKGRGYIRDLKVDFLPKY